MYFHRFCRSTVLNWIYVTILLGFCFKKCTNCRFCGIICKSCKSVSKFDVDVAQSKPVPICACCQGSKKGRGARTSPLSCRIAILRADMESAPTVTGSCWCRGAQCAPVQFGGGARPCGRTLFAPTVPKRFRSLLRQQHPQGKPLILPMQGQRAAVGFGGGADAL